MLTSSLLPGGGKFLVKTLCLCTSPDTFRGMPFPPTLPSLSPKQDSELLCLEIFLERSCIPRSQTESPTLSSAPKAVSTSVGPVTPWAGPPDPWDPPRAWTTTSPENLVDQLESEENTSEGDSGVRVGLGQMRVGLASGRGVDPIWPEKLAEGFSLGVSS